MGNNKRTLDGFFRPAATANKRARTSAESSPLPDNISSTDAQTDSKSKERPLTDGQEYSNHPTYPHPIACFSSETLERLNFCPASDPQAINDKPHLDLLNFSPFFDRSLAKDLFSFLRRELFFYRVEYAIKRPWGETQIKTPRYTTVFGVDETSYFTSAEGSKQKDIELRDSTTNNLVSPNAYKQKPRPIPDCLGHLLRATEAATGCKFNFCLVNYYADGKDSISYHSDDERFLGVDPSIASFSFGVERDFCLRHKPPVDASTAGTAKSSGYGNKGKSVTAADDFEAVKKAADNPIKFAMGSGDMILMRGQTQAQWLHSIPKRSTKNLKGSMGEQGRINITFRRAMVKGGTENYYTYNVGEGAIVYRWDEINETMREQKAG